MTARRGVRRGRGLLGRRPSCASASALRFLRRAAPEAAGRPSATAPARGRLGDGAPARSTACAALDVETLGTASAWLCSAAPTVSASTKPATASNSVHGERTGGTAATRAERTGTGHLDSAAGVSVSPATGTITRYGALPRRILKYGALALVAGARHADGRSVSLPAGCARTPPCACSGACALRRPALGRAGGAGAGHGELGGLRRLHREQRDERAVGRQHAAHAHDRGRPHHAEVVLVQPPVVGHGRRRRGGDERRRGVGSGVGAGVAASGPASEWASARPTRARAPRSPTAGTRTPGCSPRSPDT